MGELYIAGAGRGDPQSLRLLLKRELSGGEAVICHLVPPHVRSAVAEGGCRVLELEGAGMEGGSHEAPERAGKAVVEEVLKRARIEGRCAFLLPGRPWEGNSLYARLRLQAPEEGVSLRVLRGEDIWGALMEQLAFEREKKQEAAVFGSGIVLFDLYRLEELREPPRGDLLIANAAGAGHLRYAQKRLARYYTEDHEVSLLQFDRDGRPFLAGTASLEGMEELRPLHCWSFLPLPPSLRYTPGDLVYLMERLRAPGGCPWDREQDHVSLKPYLLEEAYEVLGAIDQGDDAELCEELGDLLLQVAFHSQVAAEKGAFSLWDVVTGITSKIYRRHPHVFQQEVAEDAREVSRKWQEIKRGEKKKKDRFTMSEALPSLMKAQKVQKRAAEVGFDWPDIRGALDKLREEIEELQGEIKREQKKEKLEEEVGDLLFALVNISRFLGVEAELALHKAVRKFRDRFSYIEEQVNQRGGDYSCFSLEELDGWWDEAKLREKKKRSP